MFSFLLTSSQKKKSFLFLNICRLKDIIKYEEKKGYYKNFVLSTAHL